MLIYTHSKYKSFILIFGSSIRAAFPTMNTTGYETHGNGLFQQLDEETYDTIWNYVGNKQMLKMKKASETEKGGIDMRCAIDEIYEDGLAEGEKRGIAGMLDLLKELGCSANDAKLHLKNKLHLSEDTANEYIQKCWNAK